MSTPLRRRLTLHVLRPAISVLTGLLMVAGLGWSSPRLQSLEEILPKVRAAVRNDVSAMNWNIACNLRETMRSSNRGVMGPTEWVVESVIFARGRTTPLGPGEFLWARELLSFKGNPPPHLQRSSRSGDPVPAPNPIVGNVFGNQPWYVYRLTGREQINGRPTWTIEYESNSQFPQRGEFSRGFGKAWIDPDSFRVIRIEDHLINGQTDPATTAHFEKITIAGKDLWMSTKITADIRTPIKDRVRHQLSEWSDCREYNVSVEIKPVQ